MQIIPIASGKGGVGKSLLAANLAVSLAQSGHRVILADMDIGGSNLHLALGQRRPQAGLGTYLIGKSQFESVIADTQYENLRFIPGDSEIPGLATMPFDVKIDLLKKLRSLNCDFLILDLGAGSHLHILDFFLLSPRGIVVTAPDASAILNAYLFLKNAVFRLMTNSFDQGSAACKYLVSISRNSDFFQRFYIPKLLENIEKIDEKSASAFKRRMSLFKPRLVLNNAENRDDAQKAQKIKLACENYLGICVEHLGVLHRDPMQSMALSSCLPIVAFKPQSVLSQEIVRTAKRLAEGKGPAEFARSDSEKSFERAEKEAELGFRACH